MYNKKKFQFFFNQNEIFLKIKSLILLYEYKSKR